MVCNFAPMFALNVFELSVASAMIYTELKKKVAWFFTDKAKNLWNQWELRLMVLCSLCLQYFLFKCGNRQRYTTKQRLRVILLWSAYMSADWFAAVSLKNLLDMNGDKTEWELMACWAPFLVLHLGGPDTITAYDIQDNELWKRHVFALVIQFCTALGVIVYTSSSSRDLTFATIPIFLAGIIRNSERIKALWAASKLQIRHSLLKASKKKQGNKDPHPTHVDSSQAQSSDVVMELVTQLPYKVIYDDAVYLHEAYLLYKLFRILFADLTLKFYREVHTVWTIDTKSAKEAFKLAEVELGFLYDVLHTKTTIIHSRAGMIFRCFCFLCSISSSVAFSVIFARHPNAYSKIDVAITVVLLAGAIFLDILGLHKHFNSDRMMLWLTRNQSKFAKTVYQTVSTNIGKRQPESMAQYNLIDYCLAVKIFSGIEVLRIFDPFDVLVKHQNMTEIDVDDELKEFIFLHLKDKYTRYGFSNFNSDNVGELLDARFDVIEDIWHKICGSLPEDSYDDDNKFLASFVHDMEFDKSLMIWHIATDLIYYKDEVIPSTDDIWEGVIASLKRKMSKSLSDYMFYLLSIRPYMLPKGIGEVRIRDTYEEFQRFFQINKFSVNTKEVCNALLEKEDHGFGLSNPEGPQHESSLSDAIRLAHQLQLLGEDKWEMISKVWVEMLTCAASKCEWNQHAGNLKRGKELLTQVSLIMAHLFLSEQVRLVESSDIGSRQDEIKRFDLDRLYYLA